MARVKINSEGIGVIYQKDNIWKILYPFGNCHQVNIGYKLEGSSQLIDLGSFGRAKTKLEFSTDKQNESAVKGYSFPTLFDMTDDYAHINGVKLKDNWMEQGVLFEIHNATLNVVTTNSRYELKRGDSYIRLGYIGYSISAVIDLAEEEIFSLDANGTSLFSPQIGQSYEIWVNNDCNDAAINSEAEVDRELRNTTDFAMLYNILEDKGDSGFRISVIRDRRDSPIPSNIGKFHTENTNPPRLIDGKPCHKNQISVVDSNFP